MYYVAIETDGKERKASVINADAGEDLIEIVDVMRESARRRGRRVLSIHTFETWDAVERAIRSTERCPYTWKARKYTDNAYRYIF